MEPRRTFEGLRAKAPWILPLIIWFLAIAAFSYVNWEFVIDQQIESIRSNEGIPEEAREQAVDRMRESRTNPSLPQSFIGPVVAVILSLIGAAIWLMVGNVVAGGDGTFKLIWSGFNYASMVGVVEMILKTIMIQMKGSADVYTSLALLAPDNLDRFGFAFRALNAVDVFSIWFFILMGIAVSVMCKVRPQKAMISSFAVWAVYAFGFKAGLGSVLGQFIGM
jgi:hypothetical protein